MSAVKPLTALRRGGRAAVCDISPAGESHFAKLAAFGLLPGAEVRVLQTWPATIVAVGHTVVALDRMMAAAVLVTEEEGE